MSNPARLTRVLLVIAGVLLLVLAFWSTRLEAQEPGIHLVRTSFSIDPRCNAPWEERIKDDGVTTAWKAIGIGDWPHWTLRFAHQTTPLSCPHWLQSWSVGGAVETPWTLKLPITTEAHKAFRFRATWTDPETGETKSRDWVLEPPGGGDTCVGAPTAPVCAN